MTRATVRATQPSRVRLGSQHLSYSMCYLSRLIWFWEEECTSRQAFLGDLYVPRRDNYFSRWPSAPDLVGEFKPVHRARDADIREDKANFLVPFEQSNRCVGTARL